MATYEDSLTAAFKAGAKWCAVNGADYWRFLDEDAATYSSTGREVARPIPLPDDPSDCVHAADGMRNGPRIPLRYGSAATQVCVCGMWRRMDHRPGRWCKAEDLVKALAEDDDDC